VTTVIIEKNGSEIEFQRNVVVQVHPVLSFLAKELQQEQHFLSLNVILEKCDIDQNNKLSNVLPGLGIFHVGAEGNSSKKHKYLDGSRADI
jgi:NAD-dependent DNA ligase